MQKNDLYNAIKTLLQEQVQGVLATIDGDRPCLHLMAYAFSSGLDEIYIASYADTRKVRNMLAQPNVSMMWDNRTGQHGDHVEGLALNAEGVAALVNDVDRQAVKQRLLERNPTLDVLLGNERTAIFSIGIANYVFVKGYSDVNQYTP